VITSVGNPTIRRIRRLRKSMWRVRTGLFLVEGHRSVDVALRSGAAVEEIFATGRAERLRGSVLARARAHGVRTVEVSEDVMRHLTSVTTAPDVLAVVVMDTLHFVPPKPLPAVVLIGVHDPSAAGAACGIRTAVFGSASVDPFEAKVVRAAQGAHFLVDIVQDTGDAGVIDTMRAAGARIVVLGDKGIPPWDASLTQPLCIVVAGEGEFSSPGEVEFVAVPAAAVEPPLAARSAVVLYEWKRQNEAAKL